MRADKLRCRKNTPGEAVTSVIFELDMKQLLDRIASREEEALPCGDLAGVPGGAVNVQTVLHVTGGCSPLTLVTTYIGRDFAFRLELWIRVCWRALGPYMYCTVTIVDVSVRALS